FDLAQQLQDVFVRITLPSHLLSPFLGQISGPVLGGKDTSVFKHFNSERSLYSRANFKKNPAAALAEWRQLLAV
ncbi:hypothetical protein ACFQ2S_20385, partial [Tropicimonas aquimaris]